MQNIEAKYPNAEELAFQGWPSKENVEKSWHNRDRITSKFQSKCGHDWLHACSDASGTFHFNDR